MHQTEALKSADQQETELPEMYITVGIVKMQFHLRKSHILNEHVQLVLKEKPGISQNLLLSAQVKEICHQSHAVSIVPCSVSKPCSIVPA